VVTTSPSLKPSSFPIEILHHIVGYLAETDKPSLAACMSASSTLNKLVGPKLYRNVSWTGENQDSYPFHIPVASFKRRITLPKRTLLKNINSATVEWHTPGSGCLSSPIFDKPLAVSTLIVRSGNREIDSWLAACRQCCYFAPTKLVAEGHINLSLKQSFRFNRSNLSKVVIIWNLEHIAVIPYDIFRASKCTNRQLIVIMRAQDDGIFDAVKDDFLWMAVYQTHKLLSYWGPAHFANDFVFVHTDAVDSAASGPRHNSDDFQRLADRIWTTSFARSGGSEGFAPKLISLEEYMRDYDWEGEFTEEEAESRLSSRTIW
jgi:hypothetical protein